MRVPVVDNRSRGQSGDWGTWSLFIEALDVSQSACVLVSIREGTGRLSLRWFVYLAWCSSIKRRSSVCRSSYIYIA